MSTHVIIDATSFPSARPYFSHATTEKTKSSVLPLTTSEVYDVTRIDLDKVLDKIIDKASESDDVMIVCHGTELGMSFRLKRGSGQVTAYTDALNLLSSGRPAADIAGQLSLSVSLTQSLQDRMRQVQQLNLARVEIRGCNIGQYQSTMSAIRRFFGAGTVGAPMRLPQPRYTNGKQLCFHFVAANQVGLPFTVNLIRAV